MSPDAATPAASRAGPADLQAELARVQERVHGYILASPLAAQFAPPHLREAALSYLRAGGKGLRSALLLWCCRLLGGEEETALPAAAALEVYQTWTLVHDDIIDRDARRRGGPSVHAEFAQRASTELGLSEPAAGHYGLCLGLLAGDLQHAWAITLLAELSQQGTVSAGLSLSLVRELESSVLPALLAGETLDLQYAQGSPDLVGEEQVLQMLSLKTAALWEFAARAGACLGLGRWQPDHPQVQALAAFARAAGLAFQLRDDILGLTGSPEHLGKPVGSDLREGKLTTIIAHAWRQASPAQRDIIGTALGKPAATDEEVAEAVRVLVQLGGIAHSEELAGRYQEQALAHLVPVPECEQKRWLGTLAQLMAQRTR